MFGSLLQLEKPWGGTSMTSAWITHPPLGQKTAEGSSVVRTQCQLCSPGDEGRLGGFKKAKTQAGESITHGGVGGSEAEEVRLIQHFLNRMTRR